VVILPTYHDAKMTVVRSDHERKGKPHAVVEYNQHIGAVDVGDQMLMAYPVEKSAKSVVRENVRTLAQRNSAKLLTFLQEAKSRKPNILTLIFAFSSSLDCLPSTTNQLNYHMPRSSVA